MLSRTATSKILHFSENCKAHRYSEALKEKGMEAKCFQFDRIAVECFHNKQFHLSVKVAFDKRRITCKPTVGIYLFFLVDRQYFTPFRWNAFKIQSYPISFTLCKWTTVLGRWYVKQLLKVWNCHISYFQSRSRSWWYDNFALLAVVKHHCATIHFGVIRPRDHYDRPRGIYPTDRASW